jgi:hypothetical protein
VVEYTSPMLKDIKVKNSPLWAQDPAQQIGYYASRAMCRRHFPDVILGVYTPEEMNEEMRDVTPADRPLTAQERLKLAIDKKAQQEQEQEVAQQSTPEPSTSLVDDDTPPFTDAEVLPPEDQSREQPEVEIDHPFADFLLAIGDMTEAGELVEARKQAEDFESQDSKEAAKNAILKRANSLGLKWDKKAGTFISEG